MGLPQQRIRMENKMAEIRDFDELSYKQDIKEFEVIALLNLREEPNTSAKIIRVLSVGEKISGYIDGEWIITTEGCCMKKFVK